MSQMQNRILLYNKHIHNVLVKFANFWAKELEAEAKRDRPWDDKTGNARASLHGFVEHKLGQKVVIILSHGVDYGLWLEVANSGRYAIIWPTISRNLPGIRSMLKDIFPG